MCHLLPRDSRIKRRSNILPSAKKGGKKWREKMAGNNLRRLMSFQFIDALLATTKFLFTEIVD
jgi:hypothetical protein